MELANVIIRQCDNEIQVSGVALRVGLYVTTGGRFSLQSLTRTANRLSINFFATDSYWDFAGKGCFAFPSHPSLLTPTPSFRLGSFGEFLKRNPPNKFGLLLYTFFNADFYNQLKINALTHLNTYSI